MPVERGCSAMTEGGGDYTDGRHGVPAGGREKERKGELKKWC